MTWFYLCRCEMRVRFAPTPTSFFGVVLEDWMDYVGSG